MTFHTKEAMNEVYDLFNQTLSKISEGSSEGGDSQPESEDDDDDYTSAGESTGTGRISGTASEYGDETEADFTESRTTLSVADTDGDNTNTIESGWSEFTEIKDLPEAGSVPEEGEIEEDEEFTTPTSPNSDPSHFEPHSSLIEPAVVVTLTHRPFPQRGQNRLPFMTPIVEKTESSLGAMSAFAEKEYFTAKTPCRQTSAKTPTIPEFNKDDLWSSPFQEVISLSDKENAKVPQPKLLKPSKQKTPLGTSSLAQVDAAKERAKGPIIKDSQCNPVDEGIRNIILSEIQPPLASYSGYFHRPGTAFGKGNEIRKYCKAMKGKGEKTMSLSAPPNLRFEGSSRQYNVKRELGKGAFAPVYLVENSTSSEEGEEEKPVKMGEGNFGVKRHDHEAIKMEDPPSPWEFYVIRQAKRRLGVSRPSDSIVEAYEMHLFDDECYLIEEFRNQGTLLDSVNLCRADISSGGLMDEQLVMFFAIELFRTVEALHSKGLIHGDLKADNVLVRLNNVPSESTWSPQYMRDGTAGWSEKGITLIDFGRGIDLKCFNPTVQFIADWKTSEADCAEMREMRPWTYQVDYHGLAGTIHSLLFGKYLETIAERGASLGAGATKTYKIRESLKRYWQVEIWSDVFGLLLNPLAHLEGEEGRALPVLHGMKVLRERMEGWLEANCEKGAGLKTLVKKMESAIRDKRK
jgi:checkpoint serine/threonine-protein kinase